MPTNVVLMQFYELAGSNGTSKSTHQVHGDSDLELGVVHNIIYENLIKLKPTEIRFQLLEYNDRHVVKFRVLCVAGGIVCVQHRTAPHKCYYWVTIF